MKFASIAVFFFFNDTATTEIYTLSLHDALPIFRGSWRNLEGALRRGGVIVIEGDVRDANLVRRSTEGVDYVFHQAALRSEEHTSELQSQSNLVCRLLLENKKHIIITSL